jgi:Fungal specific transcription factor domain
VSTLELDTSDMELLHHYLVSTSYTLARHPTLQTQWRKVPTFGFTTEYILRAILAISALHLAYKNPEKRHQYVSQANHHHEIALQAATPNFPHLVQPCSVAVHLFSAFTGFITCAKPPKSDNFLMLQGGTISAWLTFIRGCKGIAICTDDTLKTGPLAPMFSRSERMAQCRDQQLHDKIACLEDLRQFVVGEVADQEELRTYIDSIDELNKSFAMVFDKDPLDCEVADIFIWMLVIPKEYLVLLSQQKPVALIIFAYYGVLLRQLQWAWWMDGWSTHIIFGAYELLDNRLRAHVRWPMEQIGLASSYQSSTNT